MENWLVAITYAVYSFMVPICYIVMGILVVVGIPLLLINRTTRKIASVLLMVSSYIYGFTVWMMGAGISISSFGLLWLIIGVLLAGVGVVPIGIAGAIFKLHQPFVAIVMVVFIALAFGLRIWSLKVSEKASS